jgi:hypothetical protein
MKKPREVIQPRWGLYILRKKAERLSFTVTAAMPVKHASVRSKSTRPSTSTTGVG